MNLPYEILIRSKDGLLRGIAAYDTPGAPARPLTADELKSLVPKINKASLARIAELEADLEEARRPNGEIGQPKPVLQVLSGVFNQLQEDHQFAFAEAFAIVRSLVQAERNDLAAAYIKKLEIPSDLEPIRDSILAIL